MKYRVFVYGTLKKDRENHFVLNIANAKYLGECKTKPEYTLYSNGAYPLAIKEGNTKIKGEVFEIDSIEPLDHLEGYPSLFDRHLIDTPFGPAWMYLFNTRFNNTYKYYKILEDGEW